MEKKHIVRTRGRGGAGTKMDHDIMMLQEVALQVKHQPFLALHGVPVAPLSDCLWLHCHLYKYDVPSALSSWVSQQLYQLYCLS